EINYIERVVEHCKEEPLVPAGVFLTCGALVMSARAVRSGNRQMANKMFKYRVGFQGFTVLSLVIGGWYYDKEKKEKKTQDQLDFEKAKIRERLWIEELERRDAESNARKEKAALARLTLEKKASEKPSS
ncbi:altered inheritance of mitochondria protein 31, mitochondrial, partial [Nadsonia fulvescens var. elongata DSM 6958]